MTGANGLYAPVIACRNFCRSFGPQPIASRRGVPLKLVRPSLTLRVSILKQKLKERNSGPVPLKVLRYLAKHLTQHIRQLEGALNRLMAEVRLGSPLTLQAAHHVLENKTPDQPPSDTITLEHIQEAVARYFHLTLSELCSRKAWTAVCAPSTGRNVSCTSIDPALIERDQSRIWTESSNSCAKLSTDRNATQGRFSTEVSLLRH